MGSFFDNGPLPDWKDIQKWLGKDIPWKLVENWDQGSDSTWLNQYVKDIMKKSTRESHIRTQTQSIIHMEATKDTKYVHVTIRLSPEMDTSKLQLFATSDRLMLRGLPSDGKRALRFPCPVYARSGKAQLKKDRLLVRFKRKPLDKSEVELFIRT